MELKHSFTVPTPVAETWAHFEDLGALAECFPGATIGDYDERSFTGSVKVKLGPIALVYNGSGTFVEKDEDAHRFVVDAKGKDKRGNGTAGATVVLAMADVSGSTEVDVTTDLSVTGKPAQFGRGVMQDVSDKLLGQFVNCLEQRLSAPAESATTEDATAATAPTASGASTGDEAHGEPAVVAPSPAAPVAAGEPGSSAPSTRPRPVVAVAPATSSPGDSLPPTPSPGATGGSSDAASGTAASGTAATSGRAPAPSSDDALDLGAAVLPVLAKAYWKQGAALGVVLLLIAWLLGRRD